MGQYIEFGLCYEIIIPPEAIETINKEYATLEKYLPVFEKETNIKIDLYDIEKIKNYYKLTLKESVFSSQHLASFLNDFIQDLNTKDDEERKKLIEELKTDLSRESLIELAKTKYYINFQHSYIIEHIYGFSFGRDIRVQYNYINFFMEGKVIMECYGTLFRYIENMLRKNHNEELRYSTKVFLSE